MYCVMSQVWRFIIVAYLVNRFFFFRLRVIVRSITSPTPRPQRTVHLVGRKLLVHLLWLWVDQV